VVLQHVGLVQFGGGDQAAARHGSVAPAGSGLVQKGDHVGLWRRWLIGGAVGGGWVGVGGGAYATSMNARCGGVCLLIAFAAVAPHVVVVAGAAVAAVCCMWGGGGGGGGGGWRLA